MLQPGPLIKWCAYCGNCVSNKGEQVRETLGGYRCLASVSGWTMQHSSGSALLSRGLCLLHFVLLSAALVFGCRMLTLIIVACSSAAVRSDMRATRPLKNWVSFTLRKSFNF